MRHVSGLKYKKNVLGVIQMANTIQDAASFESNTMKKVRNRLIPFLTVLYFFAMLDIERELVFAKISDFLSSIVSKE